MQVSHSAQATYLEQKERKGTEQGNKKYMKECEHLYYSNKNSYTSKVVPKTTPKKENYSAVF